MLSPAQPHAALPYYPHLMLPHAASRDSLLLPAAGSDMTFVVDVDERSPLLLHATPGSRLHISKMLLAQQMLEREKILHRRRIVAISALVILAVIAIALLSLCVQPLASVAVAGVANIVASPDLFQFDLRLAGSNFNIIPIDVAQADLDVYASADIPRSLADAAPQNPSQPAPPHPAAAPAAAAPSAAALGPELLGHVRRVNSSVVFPLLANAHDLHATITIVDPSNTLGKLIYLHYPYTLIVRGQLQYATLFSLTRYAIPVCSIHVVDGPNSVRPLPCDALKL
ncbi:hypothetical protein HK105_200324 [Polyrhizophydium stewartii]|uniref:Late embryogenesis abundant protein LEA-2 subgroup domain-containing protein n=1 Tax=Polyrhizophydium stewartii TaxID=2732419 RepID=A0ABR4NL47_9FUNG|nr:hypothetical protein HK105_007767 [Polyrhizophydium stewartii]